MITSNANAVAADFRRAARDLERSAVAMVRQAADDALPAVVQATPVDTGALRDAWTVRHTRDGAVIENRSRYAGYVADGALRDEPTKAYAEQIDGAPPFAFPLPQRLP